MIQTIFIQISAFFGFFAVLLAAMGAHAFKTRLASSENQERFQKAVHYQMTHAVVLLLCVLFMQQYGATLAWQVAAYALTVGIVLFSGGLYCLSLLHIEKAASIVPLGGMSFLLAWASIGVAVI